MTDLEKYTADAVELLKRLIAIPSISRDEADCAAFLAGAIRSCGFEPQQAGNNVFIIPSDYDTTKETVLLNAHIDTVRPVASWSRDPFTPTVEGDRIYGLGSNDCGGGLVALLQAFRILSTAAWKKRNLIYLASCEEEVSGSHGIVEALPLLPRIDVAIVGEPTSLRPAIAEKGLMVLDITSRGQSGHAARREGVNAIYEMLGDIEWLRSYKFGKVSPFLGETLMQVTQISAGTQHNVVPDVCHAVVDVRTNEFYDNERVYDFVRGHCRSEVKARSFRLRSSHIDESHPLVARCRELGLEPFGSPTLSDQALMPFPSFKLGPGDSARSHSADEYVTVSEIRDAIRLYVELLGA